MKGEVESVILEIIDKIELNFENNEVVNTETTEEVVQEASELILTPQNYPMIVMCNLGRHRTGRDISEFASSRGSGVILTRFL